MQSDWAQLLHDFLMSNGKLARAVALTFSLLVGCEGRSEHPFVPLATSQVPLDKLVPLVSQVPLREDSQHPIGKVSSVALTPWGDIVVADGAMREVKVFDRHGRYSRLLGRTGSGPGEFTAPANVLMSGEDVLVGDAGQPRFLVFSRDSSRGVRTVQYNAPGLIGEAVSPWRGDSVLVLGVMNRITGDSVFDAALVDSAGRLAARYFRRPQEFDHKGLAINLGGTYATRSTSFAFFSSSLWSGVIRHRLATSQEDTLYLPPQVFATVVFPDTALSGPHGLTDFAKANPQITDLVALNDSILFLTIRVWDYQASESQFKIARLTWSDHPSVLQTALGHARLKAALGDTVIVVRGAVGDTIWIEKRVLPQSVP